MITRIWRTIPCALMSFTAFVCFSTNLHAQPTFSYSKNQNSVVLTYSRTPGELEAVDPTTYVTIFGNGRVEVDFPAFSPRKGKHQMRLPDGELDQLLAGLVQNNVMEFSEQSLVEQNASSAQPLGIKTYIADADVSRVTITLTEYAADGASERAAAQKRISVSGLQALQRQFPSDNALSALADVERKLIAIIDSDDLRPAP
jgi:hypothetical protein